MPLYHIVRQHEYVVEADTEAKAEALLADKEADALRDGYAASETVSARPLTNPETVRDDLLDAVPYNGSDETARTILNR
jgi:hypothetical protein